MGEECKMDKSEHGEGGKCGCQENGKECSCGDMQEKLMKITYEAWHCLMKDKIKAEIEKKQGGQMDKLAEILADASKDKWKHKIAMKMKKEEYKTKLKDFFMQDK